MRDLLIFGGVVVASVFLGDFLGDIAGRAFWFWVVLPRVTP